MLLLLLTLSHTSIKIQGQTYRYMLRFGDDIALPVSRKEELENAIDELQITT